ncbi:MAG: sigma 54-interacting transcriptional regulator [Candidatus Korobacteraceae bacterium]
MIEQEKAALKFAALEEMCRAISSHGDLSEVFVALSPQVSQLLPSHYVSVVLHDEERGAMRLHVLHSSKSTPGWLGQDFKIDDSPSGIVWQSQEVFICKDLAREKRFRKVGELLREHRVRSLCVLPLITPTGPLGAMTIGREEIGGFDEDEVGFAKLIAAQVALAVENALFRQRSAALQRELTRERDRLQTVLELNNAVVSNLDPRALFAALSANLRKVVEYDSASLFLPEDAENLRLHALDFPDSRGYLQRDMLIGIEGTNVGAAFKTGEGRIVGSGALPFSNDGDITRIRAGEGFQSLLVVPLESNGTRVGVLSISSRREHAFSSGDLNFATQIARQVAIAISNALQHSALSESKEQISEQKFYLEEEIRSEQGFEDIIGGSSALRHVLEQVETVAPTDSTVLISGETGTGKELIARAIHERSARQDRTFVRINCAAIPLGLLESELFGHEKGAFTGAITRKIGRFELAHHGSLFLDEVGDIPPELQPKLLRVLQEREFERLGSSRTQRVDVRLIAATNHHLPGMVAEGTFRSDLFYRLNVFPITVPPLRDRAEDIPLLVRYFVSKYARRMNKHIERIQRDTIASLVEYSWPGNVRELQNFIERAVILTAGEELTAPLAELCNTTLTTTAGPDHDGQLSLHEIEKSRILQALRQSKWVVGGPQGAAACLGIKRTTLLYRMERLGISRQPTSVESKI